MIIEVLSVVHLNFFVQLVVRLIKDAMQTELVSSKKKANRLLC